MTNKYEENKKGMQTGSSLYTEEKERKGKQKLIKLGFLALAFYTSNIKILSIENLFNSPTTIK